MHLKKKTGKRGGKALQKPKQEPVAKKASYVTISKSIRTTRKSCTNVSGLDQFGINLKNASQLFRKKFACGANVLKDGSIELQGDLTGEVKDFILQQEWGIQSKHIIATDDGKKHKTRKKNQRPRGRGGKQKVLVDQ